MQDLIELAKAQLNIPYVWGGNNPFQGFDCSGFVRWILLAAGLAPQQDQTAQDIYEQFRDKSRICGGADTDIEPGTLIFYGKSNTKIRHIAFAISKTLVIEAGGGDSSYTGRDVMKKCKVSGACVRIRPWNYRKDFFAALKPRYEDVGIH